MHHQFDPFFAEDSRDLRFIAQVCIVVPHLAGHGGAMAIDKVVEHHGTMARRDELADAMTADVAGTSDDEYVHNVRPGNRAFFGVQQSLRLEFPTISGACIRRNFSTPQLGVFRGLHSAQRWVAISVSPE